MLGYFVSGHPLDHYRQEVEMFSTHSTNRMKDLPERTKVTVCGLFKGVGVRTTKKGTKLASGSIEDLTGAVDIICFQNAIDRIGEEKFNTDKPVVLKGTVKFEGEDEESRKPEIMVDNIEYLSDVRSSRITHIQFLINDDHTPDDIYKLEALLSAPEYQGTTYSYLKYCHDNVDAQMRLPQRINLTDEFLHSVDQLLGLDSYTLK